MEQDRRKITVIFPSEDESSVVAADLATEEFLKVNVSQFVATPEDRATLRGVTFAIETDAHVTRNGTCVPKLFERTQGPLDMLTLQMLADRASARAVACNEERKRA